MSNNYWDEEDDDLDTEVSGDGSDLIKKLRKAKRADEKRIKELTEQLETYTKAQRENTVKSVLEKKGVNPKAARLILKEIDDVNEETVSNWLDDNADLFGIKVETEDAPKVDTNNLAALRQQDIVTQGAVTPERADELSMKLENAGSAEELIAFLRSQQ